MICVVDVRGEKQVGIIRKLPAVETLVAKFRTLFVGGEAVDDTDALSLFVACGDAHLVVCRKVFTVDKCLKKPVVRRNKVMPFVDDGILSGNTFFVEKFDAGARLDAFFSIEVEPAVVGIDVLDIRHIQKGIIIVVVRFCAECSAEQQFCPQVFAYLDCRSDIGFVVLFFVCIKIYKQRRGKVGLLEFEIHLSGDGFVAVDHRCRTFGQLNGFEPRGRRVIQTVSSSQSAQRGNIFRQHLTVYARQAEQLYLLRARNGISISHRNGSTVLETFGEIAARHFD
ncbi:hypothetical protein Barb6_03785 [Bacteroidales bacterium Barb6]|nr:hypothetical protein Barb6_03785 [Bacteroidales bacterium Barb6]